jgi:FAD/FMN-containing dehydrogenase
LQSPARRRTPIENGFNHQGFVLALEVLPCIDSPQSVEIAGDDTKPFIHAYGTTGVITTLTVKLVPARTWMNLWTSFPTMAQAGSAARELMKLTPRPRLTSITEPALVQTFPRSLGIPLTLVSVRAVVEASVRAAAERIVRETGGDVETVPTAGEIAPSLLSFNHITLRAKQARPELFHLQIRRPPVDALHVVHDAAPGSMIHLDGLRLGDEPGFAGLFLAPFVSEGAVYELIERLRSLSITVIDPHTWLLGSHLPDEAAWRRLLDVATKFDPDALLNPGRIPESQRVDSLGELI